MIRNMNDAYKLATQIDEALLPREFCVIAGERIEKGEVFMYLPDREQPHWTPCELAEFVIWPNRKAWNAAIKTVKAKKQ